MYSRSLQEGPKKDAKWVSMTRTTGQKDAPNHSKAGPNRPEATTGYGGCHGSISPGFFVFFSTFCFSTQLSSVLAVNSSLKRMYLAAKRREIASLTYTNSIRDTLERLEEEEARASEGNNLDANRNIVTPALE